MGVHVIGIFRPKPGKEEALATEIALHLPLLRQLGLATDAPSLVLRASDGCMLEHFEWVDQAAIDSAHSHPDVLAMWERYSACCEYVTLADLPNASSMFPEFEYVSSY